MILGITIMEWNEKGGAELLMKYPEDLNVSENIFIQLYSAHEFSGDTGMISLLIEPHCIVSYYTGQRTKLYLILVLSMDEDPDIYENLLANISLKIITRELDDLTKKAMILNSMGEYCLKKEKLTDASTFFEDALKIAEDLEDINVKLKVLINTGKIYNKEGNSSRALSLFEDALKITESSNDLSMKMEIMNNIALIYQNLACYSDAFRFYEDSIKIAIEIGDSIMGIRYFEQLKNAIEEYELFLKQFK